MAETWIVFKDRATGRKFCAYTEYGTFPGEREATAAQLAEENGIPVEQIEVEKIEELRD